MREASPFFRNVAMYLRKSRAEEGEDTEVVLARHKAQLTKYAVENRVNVIQIYEEIVSGDSLLARPHMMEMLRDIEANQYTGVLCMDIDRLGRGNMKEQGLILETLKDTGTAIITPDHVYDLGNELDETATEFKTFMARQELKIIKKRLSRGRRMTIEKGGYVSNVPFGYIRAYKDKIPTLAPHPQESEYVKLIFQWYIEGDGCPAICHKLTAMGIKAPRGSNFSRNTIRKILTNPVYIGKIAWGQKKHIRPKKPEDKYKTVCIPHEQWLLFDGLHPPIIDKTTFQKANTILTGRYHPPYHFPGQIKNPLAGVLLCRQCGHAMILRPYANRKYQTDHILCQTLGCVKSARADYVEQAVLRELELKLQHLEFESPPLSLGPETTQTQTILASVRSEYNKLIKQRERLYDLLEQGVYTAAIFTERERLLSSRIEEIRKDIHSMDTEVSAKRRRAEVLIPRIHHVLQEYWGSTPAEKNNMLKSVIKRALYFKAKSAAPQDFSIEIELCEDSL